MEDLGEPRRKVCREPPDGMLVGMPYLEGVLFCQRPGETVVVNGFGGLGGLAESVAALEAGNRLLVADRGLVARSGPVLFEAAGRGGGTLTGQTRQ